MSLMNFGHPTIVHFSVGSFPDITWGKKDICKITKKLAILKIVTNTNRYNIVNNGRKSPNKTKP